MSHFSKKNSILNKIKGKKESGPGKVVNVNIAGIARSLAFVLLGFSIGYIYLRKQPQPTIIIENENLTNIHIDDTKYMGFSIKYSDQWIAEFKQPGEEEKVKLSRKDETTNSNCAVELRVHIADLGEALSLNKYKNTALNRIKKDSNNSPPQENEGKKLSTYDAYQIVYNRQQDGCKLKVLERGTMSFKKGYYIIYQVPEQDDQRLWTVVEKMIDSFVIQDGK